MRVCAAAAAATIGIAASGCGREELTGPPSMRLGRAECAECGMLINEERCSSAMLISRQRRREYLMFDDIGCMLDYEEAHLDPSEVVERFVHDHGTPAWVVVGDAVFLFTGADELFTPMGSGMVAFGSGESAEQARVKYGGEVLGYADLRAVRQAWLERRRSGAGNER